MTASFGFAGIPFGAFSLGGTDANGESMQIIAFEAPEFVLADVGGPRPKNVMERIHLERYRLDHLIRTGTVPFERVAEGGDPPDFEVELREGGSEALDCAAFTLGEYRGAYRLFRLLRTRLERDADPSDFEGVRGCVLQVSFGDGQLLPPKRSDEKAVEALAALIAGFTVDRERIARLTADAIAAGRMPEQIPIDLFTTATPDGSARLIASIGAPFGTEFSRKLGFECHLAMSTCATASTVTGEFQRLINDHDKPEIRHLLITVGGPDRDGFRYPAEELVLPLIDGHTFGWKHLRAATVHRWSDGAITPLPGPA
jgi:hypothetical protein